MRPTTAIWILSYRRLFLLLLQLAFLQWAPTWPQEQNLFISMGPPVGWIGSQGLESHKLKEFFWPERGAVVWAELLFSTSCSQIWCGHSEIMWIQQRKEIHGRGSFYCVVCSRCLGVWLHVWISRVYLWVWQPLCWSFRNSKKGAAVHILHSKRYIKPCFFYSPTDTGFL